MKLEVSIGEAIDKLSILELKKQKIADPVKLEEIQKEIDALADVQNYKTQLPFFYKLLSFVNDQIWIMTDRIKMMDIVSFAEDGPLAYKYASLAHDIFEYNQKRFRIKRFFNVLLDSTIKEQKSYADSVCYVWIENEDVLFSKLSELFFLSISYDNIQIDPIYQHILARIIAIPSITFFTSATNFSESNLNTSIHLSNFSISKDLQNVFLLEPIRYINGGMFGDFIHSLSVINEKYYETGRKGVLFIAEGYGSDRFRYGVQTAFQDTFDIITHQPYIHSYSIYDPEKDGSYDINLNDWRGSPFLFQTNWCIVYSATYQVPWGKHQWIKVPQLEKDPKWENKVVINTTSYRFSEHMNFKELYDIHGENLVFITMDESNYQHFLSRTSLSEIPCHILTSFTELCTIFASCKLFIGCPSGPLAVAFAMHIPCVIAMHSDPYEITMMRDINQFLQFVQKIQ